MAAQTTNRTAREKETADICTVCGAGDPDSGPGLVLIALIHDTAPVCNACERILVQAVQQLIDGLRCNRGLQPWVKKGWWE